MEVRRHTICRSFLPGALMLVLVCWCLLLAGCTHPVDESAYTVMRGDEASTADAVTGAVGTTEEMENTAPETGQQQEEAPEETTADAAEEKNDEPDEEALRQEQIAAFLSTVEMEEGLQSLFFSPEELFVIFRTRELPETGDGALCLFALPFYEDAIGETDEPIAAEEAATEVVFSIQSDHPADLIYQKYVVAVRDDEGYRMLTDAACVTNPEMLTEVKYGGMAHSSKKGLFVEPEYASEVGGLGIQYTICNIPLSQLITTDPEKAVYYSYCDREYSYNREYLSGFDDFIRKMNGYGADVAVVLLNDAPVSHFPEYTHPSARGKSSALYRMFNGTTEEGVSCVAAAASFLAGRYSGGDHGAVSMWIIGNEINARMEWNYMNTSDLSDYAEAYADAFRVCYNAIRSQNASAKVYISLDQQWNRGLSGKRDFDARDLLEQFAMILRREGDIDWGLSIHPYSFPMSQSAFWKSSSEVKNDVDSPRLTMQNIEVLTDYMLTEPMLDRTGSPRSVIVSELGYSSLAGEEVQTAAFVYAYVKIENNPGLDALIFSRLYDAPVEIEVYRLYLGLMTTDGEHKMIYDAFRDIDTDRADSYLAEASAVTGVELKIQP